VERQSRVSFPELLFRFNTLSDIAHVALNDLHGAFGIKAADELDLAAVAMFGLER
jgi:hypothetical protein